jgi:nucleotidyltransferase substrate binding protein (TIGR01987 family)
LIQRYEYSIELAWKTIKDYLENQGFADIGTPKKAVRRALNSGLIKNPNWIKALNDRNKTSHAYNEDMAQEVTNEIQQVYFYTLQELADSLKKELIPVKD